MRHDCHRCRWEFGERIEESPKVDPALHSPTSSWWFRTKLVSPNDLILLACALFHQLSSPTLEQEGAKGHTSNCCLTAELPALCALISSTLRLRSGASAYIVSPVSKSAEVPNRLTSYNSCSFGVATAVSCPSTEYLRDSAHSSLSRNLMPWLIVSWYSPSTCSYERLRQGLTSSPSYG